MKKLRNLNWRNDNGGYVVSLAVALLIAAILLGVYYVAMRPVQNGYMTIYLLDGQGQAVDYPEVLVSGQNSTFTVQVVVENHMGNTTDCQVLVKTTQDLSSIPVSSSNTTETFTAATQNGDVWKNTATVTLNEPGYYGVVFELWTSPNKDAQPYQFSGVYCVLNVQVTS